MNFRDLLYLTKKALKLENTKFLKVEEQQKKDSKLKNVQYRIVVINDTTLREAFSAMLTRRKVYVFLSTFCLINLVFWFFVFSYTPIRALIPEDKNTSEKQELVELKKKIDSLEKIFELNDNYIQQYKGYFTSHVNTSNTINNNQK